MTKSHWTAEASSYRHPNSGPVAALVYDPTPGGRQNDDGSTSFGLRFPALIVTEYVSDPQVAAQKIADKLNSYASSQAEIERLRTALEYAAKGLDMIHNGLMDPTRPRQAVGEVCAHFLEAARAALSGSKDNA